MAARKLEVVIVGDSSSLQRALGKADIAAGRFGKGLGGHVKNLAKFAAGGAGVLAVGEAFTKTAALTVDFDKSMRNVNSIAQLNEKQFGSLSKSVLSLAGKTAQAPKTLADGLYDLVSSGFNAKQSLVILQSSAKAATAGLTTTEVATKAVAAVLNSYHRPAKDAADVSDVLFQTVNRGVITFETLANNIGTVLPFAASLGVNLNQVGAAISTMTKGGISGELSITYLKNAMVSFLKPSQGMADAIKATGEKSGEALVKAKGFQGALQAVIGTTDGTKKSVAKLFPNIRSLTAALALTGRNSKTAKGDLAAFKDVAGATDKALSQQRKSIAFQWQDIKAKISAAAIEVGSKLLPVVSTGISEIGRIGKKVGDVFSGLKRKFDDLTKGGPSAPQQGILKRLGVDPSDLKKKSPLGAIGTMIGDAIKSVDWKGIGNTMAAGLSKAFNATGNLPGVIADGIGLALSKVNTSKLASQFADIGVKALATIADPMFWIHHLSEAFALVTIVIPIGKIFKIPGMGFLFEKLSKPLFSIVARVASGLADIGGRLFGTAFTHALVEVEKVAPRFAGVVLKISTAGVNELKKLPGLLFSPARKAGNSVVGALDGVAGNVGKAAGKMVSAAISAMGKITAPFRSLASRAANAVAVALYDGAGAAESAAKKLGTAALNALKGLLGGFASIGQAIVQAVLNGMGDLGGAIAGKIRSAIGGAKGLAKKALHAIIGAASFPGLPSLSAIEGTANSRVSGLLFPATRKGDILEGLAKQAVNARRRALTIAKNNAADAHKAHPKSKSLAKEYQDATKALRDFNVEAKTYVGIFHKQNVGLQAIQKFKDAIQGLRDKMTGLAGDAASAFRATREKQIATGPEAKELARLQGIDAAQQDTQTTDQLNQALADAKAAGDVKAQKDAQDAIDAYARQKQEQALQDQIDAQNAGLDTEEANYQASLDSQLQALTTNLDNGKESYKKYVSDVQAILGPLGVAFAGDPNEEQDINPVGTGSAPKGKSAPKHHKRKKRAVGGAVMAGMSYDVGELGPEVFTPGTSGTITQASQSKGSGGIYMDFRGSRIGSQKAARIMANKLAFRVAFG